MSATAGMALLATIAGVVASGASGAGEPRGTLESGARAAALPNFLFVLTDDQSMNSFRRRYMPETYRWIVDRGTKFTDAIATPPLCCPARAGLMTGQYPHNHHVWSNHPGYAELTDRANTLPTWLKRAGYRTGFFGKFLNHYQAVRGLDAAPGFDRWFALLNQRLTYYDYKVSDDGERVLYGHDRADYSTDVLTDQAAAFMRDSAGQGQPFFAWLAYNAPHTNHLTAGPCAGNNPVPPDVATFRRFADVPLPRPDSFDEPNIADKPRTIADLRRLDRETIARIALRWRCTLAAMSGVDDALGRLRAQLHDAGLVRDTIVIYLSDNGVFFGEHRIPTGKGIAYEPSLRVPFAAFVPRAFRDGRLDPHSDEVVASQDIAPTLLRYVKRYGGSASPCNPDTNCRRIDGRSLLPLLHGGGHWRDGDRGVLVELDSRRTAESASTAKRRRVDPECNCAYEAIRTHRYLYTELAERGRELYDLDRDPDELRNRVHSRRYRDASQRLAKRLSRLERCSGQRGRESRAGAPFCN